MRVVGEFDCDCPALVDGVLDLGADLVVAEIGQVRERALGDAHESLLGGRLAGWCRQAVGVATTSGVSVDS